MKLRVTSKELIEFFKEKTNLEKLDEIQIVVTTETGLLSTIDFSEDKYYISPLIKDEIKREGVENENYTD